MKNIEVIQNDISDCGACSLLSIIRYYKGDDLLENIKYETCTNSKGVSAYNLVQYAKNNGFVSYGINTYDLEKINLPCILHLKINDNLNHFVVLYQVKSNKVLIMDPAKGLRKMNKTHLLNMMTGNVLILIKKGNVPNKINKNETAKILKSDVFKFKYKILFLVFLNLILLLFNYINSNYISYFDKNYSYYLIIFITITNVLISLLTYYINYSIEKLKYNININFVNKFTNFLYNLPLKILHIKDSQELIKRINESDELSVSLVDIILNVILDMIMSISIFIILFINSRVLGYISIIYIFIIIITYYFLFKNIRYKISDVLDNDLHYSNKLIDYTSGINSVIHTYRQTNIVNKINECFKLRNQSRIKYNLYIKKSEIFIQTINHLYKILSCCYFFKFIILTNHSFPVFVFISIMIDSFVLYINSICNYYPVYNYIKESIIRINNIYNIKNINKSKTKYSFGDITLSNLTFSYNNFSNIIDNLNLKIMCGEKIILKGKSGAGKSTICKLIVGDIEATKGHIYLDGKDIYKVKKEELLNKISYSSQSEYIFNDTIINNITLGKNISENALNKIIDICEINSIIKDKVLGLNTVLSNNGIELSGGERQRIILARALTKNFDILILDETLSEVNNNLESKIIDNLYKNFCDKTIIYVTHKNNDYKGKIIYV